MLVDGTGINRRGNAIAALGVIDRTGDPELTALCRLAAYVAGASAAAVHILDEEVQRRVAAVHAPLGAHPREDSMCHLVVDSQERIVCADASQDSRFGYSSLVQGPDPVRLYVSVPLRTSQGSIVGTLCAFDTVAGELSNERLGLFEDLADQVSRQIELKSVALELGPPAGNDPLTGAVNRAVLSDRLGQAFARQLRYGGRILLAMVDIDGFKRVNDVHGHAAGDEVLAAVARRLITAVRSEDTVARVGGHAFIVLAEVNESRSAQTEVVGRVQRALAEPIVFAGQPRSVSASVGRVFTVPGEDVCAALRRAHQALYARKTLIAR